MHRWGKLIFMFLLFFCALRQHLRRFPAVSYLSLLDTINGWNAGKSIVVFFVKLENCMEIYNEILILVLIFTLNNCCLKCFCYNWRKKNKKQSSNCFIFFKKAPLLMNRKTQFRLKCHFWCTTVMSNHVWRMYLWKSSLLQLLIWNPPAQRLKLTEAHLTSTKMFSPAATRYQPQMSVRWGETQNPSKIIKSWLDAKASFYEFVLDPPKKHTADFSFFLILACSLIFAFSQPPQGPALQT